MEMTRSPIVRAIPSQPGGYPAGSLGRIPCRLPPFLNRTAGNDILGALSRGATHPDRSSLVPGGRLPLRAGIESRAGLNCSGTGSNERRQRAGKGTRVTAAPMPARCCCRLLCTLKRFAPRALKKYLVSAQAIAMTIAGGFKQPATQAPTLQEVSKAYVDCPTRTATAIYLRRSCVAAPDHWSALHSQHAGRYLSQYRYPGGEHRLAVSGTLGGADVDRIITITERALTTTVDNIEHIESNSLYGVAVVKIYFQPQVNLSMAIAQVTAISQAQLQAASPRHHAALHHRLQRVERARSCSSASPARG